MVKTSKIFKTVTSILVIILSFIAIISGVMDIGSYVIIGILLLIWMDMGDKDD